jgi:hypothetical protein
MQMNEFQNDVRPFFVILWTIEKKNHEKKSKTLLIIFNFQTRIYVCLHKS